MPFVQPPLPTLLRERVLRHHHPQGLSEHQSQGSDPCSAPQGHRTDPAGFLPVPHRVPFLPAWSWSLRAPGAVSWCLVINPWLPRARRLLALPLASVSAGAHWGPLAKTFLVSGETGGFELCFSSLFFLYLLVFSYQIFTGKILPGGIGNGTRLYEIHPHPGIRHVFIL